MQHKSPSEQRPQLDSWMGEQTPPQLDTWGQPLSRVGFWGTDTTLSWIGESQDHPGQTSGTQDLLGSPQ